MFVWRDKNGRIASVTGSVHARTLEYLKAEDEHRATARSRPAADPRGSVSVPKAQRAKVQSKPEPDKPEPQDDSKGVNNGDND